VGHRRRRLGVCLGSQDDEESIAAIHRALDLAINWYWTRRRLYGLGHSEEVVGRALKSASKKPYVFTKCSMRWDANRTIYRSLKAASVAEEVEAAAGGGLAVEQIDLYQIHWPTRRRASKRVGRRWLRAKEQGKLRWKSAYRISTLEQMKRIQKIGAITSLQRPTPCCDAPLKRRFFHSRSRTTNRRDQLFADGVRIADGKMTARADCGYAADDWRRKSIEFIEPRLSKNMRPGGIAARSIGGGHGVTPGVCSVAYTLHHPGHNVRPS